MMKPECPRMLRRVVLADEATVGGVKPGNPGRWLANKAQFMAAMELDGNGNRPHLRVHTLAVAKGSILASGATTALHSSAHRVTDGLASNAAPARVANYGAIVVSPPYSSELEVFRRANTFFSNLKRAIHGSYHHFDFKNYRHVIWARHRSASTGDLSFTSSSVGQAALRRNPP